MLQTALAVAHSLCCCSYECIRCGDKSRFDVKFEADDDENEAYAVMDNLKAAMANKYGVIFA